MKKVFLFALLLTGLISKAQDYLGFNQSNYAGVSGIYAQPASIANGRDRFDMSLAGVSFYAYNNYIGLNSRALCDPLGSAEFETSQGIIGKGQKGPHNFNDPNFQQNYMVTNESSHVKNVFIGSRIAGPSFLININHKNAIAFAFSERNYVNIDNISQPFAHQLFTGVKDSTQYGSILNNKHLSAQEMSWMEYGLTFAHVFTENTEHFFKAGVTLNLLQGIQSAYIYVKDFNYKFKNDTTISVYNTQINYGHSSNLTALNGKSSGGGNGTGLVDFSQSYPGVSFNFGVVYEWRPNFVKYEYDMDGEHNLWRRDQNKYKLKLGLTVSDLGSIKFKKGPTSFDFVSDVTDFSLHQINGKDLNAIDSSLKANFTSRTTSESYKMALPTVISVQADYNLGHNFFLNLTPYFAFQYKNRVAKVHDISSLTFTPRWDHKWLGAFVPIQYNLNDGFRAGLALRLGPLAFGTSNIAPLIGLGGRTIYGMDAYVILKIPIPYGKPKDKDKDGISNKKDKCKTVPGVWEFMGCPDTDGDHIPDSEDKCPTVAGTKEMKGCPDKDGDGITDLEDACPDEKGPIEFKGCPDRDGDRIIDKDDACPDDAGTEEFKGCPDKDGDKVIDKEDLCPDLAGPIEYKGCPDKDGDTVLDKDDACPDVAGPVENKGCPWPDTDKDGVIDKEDDCPNVPGTKELKGCPPVVIKAEEQKIIEKAFASLEFATGKDIIKATSFPSLNDLAKILKQHTADWVLKLSGHTDNQGDAAKNMLLSEKRAKAVKKYLVAKGEKADRVVVEWFGQTKPIDTNDTPEGRQRNRRVEMKIIKK
jgi:outer membrane protein OmpA-like peptidoglycan-associated protein